MICQRWRRKSRGWRSDYGTSRITESPTLVTHLPGPLVASQRVRPAPCRILVFAIALNLKPSALPKRQNLSKLSVAAQPLMTIRQWPHPYEAIPTPTLFKARILRVLGQSQQISNTQLCLRSKREHEETSPESAPAKLSVQIRRYLRVRVLPQHSEERCYLDAIPFDAPQEICQSGRSKAENRDTHICT